MSVPKNNINLCFVGGVSTGKSTILNAIFCEELTQCKIKRTTMVPTIYVENEVAVEDPASIYKKIADKNKEIIEFTESGQKLDNNSYNELIFNVGKLDINIMPSTFVNVYDIPGLNDARTKDVYYNYLNDHFHKFNLIVLLVDIHSGLNTSDEIDIVNFVSTRIAEQLEKNQRKIYTLVVVNKADDMQLADPGSSKLVLTGELSEMYEQTEKTINDIYKQKGVSDQLVGILPLCAIDAYLYRMVKKYGADYKLTPEQILKIGINENGKRFSTLKPATQEAKVRTILSDESFVDTMIQLSGFRQFEHILHDFLCNNDTSKHMCIDNLLFELRGWAPLSHTQFIGTDGWFVMDLFESAVMSRVNLYNKIKPIDEGTFMLHMDSLYDELLMYMQQRFQQIYKNTPNAQCKKNYDYFEQNIFAKYFAHINSTGYPSYFTDMMMEKIMHQFSYTRLNINDIVEQFALCVSIGVFEQNSCEKLLYAIINNIHGCSTIDDSQTVYSNALLHLIKHLQTENVQNLMKFVKFILINRFHNNSWTGVDRLNIYLSYKNHGEVALSSYMYAICNIQHAISHNHMAVIDWQPDEGLDNLDLFYLKNSI